MFSSLHSNPKRMFNIIDSLVSIHTDVNIIINSCGLYIKQMDSSHVCYTLLDINKDEFKEFIFDSKLNSFISIGINLKNLASILNACKESNSIQLQLLDIDKLYIISKTVYDIKEFSLSLIDIDSEILDIPDSDYYCEFRLSSDIFNSIIDSCEIMKGKDLQFNIYNKKLTILCIGELGEYKQIFNEKEYLEKKIKIIRNEDNTKNVKNQIKKKENYSLNVSKVNFSIKYNIDMMINFKKGGKLVDIININLKPDSPMRLDIMLNDNNGSCIQFYLAPKMDD